MKAKTEELLYIMYWTCGMLYRPTFRNLSESFEGWAYRNGLLRQLAELERRKFLESRALDETTQADAGRVHRLTEAGRIHALGGRDPEACWRRPWDGRWHLALYDLPAGKGTERNRLRNFLRANGFGWLQKSVWANPFPLSNQRPLLDGASIDVESLLFLEARPSAGETDSEIVQGAWNFKRINDRYGRCLQVIESHPCLELQDESAANRLRKWAERERQAWTAAVSADPLLPNPLLPPDYLGKKVWESRTVALQAFAEQLREYRP